MDSAISTLWTGYFPIEGVSDWFLLSLNFIEIPVFNANSVDTVDQNPSLAITVWHQSANFMIPDSDLWDGFFLSTYHTNDRSLYSIPSVIWRTGMPTGKWWGYCAQWYIVYGKPVCNWENNIIIAPNGIWSTPLKQSVRTFISYMRVTKYKAISVHRLSFLIIWPPFSDSSFLVYIQWRIGRFAGVLNKWRTSLYVCV